MRGKAFRTAYSRTQSRITPAYAGKRQIIKSTIVIYWDHPRLCGEKDRCGNCRNGEVGSPPPMRGKVAFNIFLPHFIRITPAYAGKRVKIAVGGYEG